jgi:phosphoribosylformimino-5-aminoimidazole carboxamide ribotide isomerase
MLQGPAYDVYTDIKNMLPDMFTIASGGVSDIEDVEKLNSLEIDGVIIGKAIYEGNIQLKQLKKFLC